jgi:hypothetical protein
MLSWVPYQAAGTCQAIDLVDEAASRLRMQQESKPEVIDRLDHELLTLRIELEALKKESDAASRERRQALEAELVATEAKVQKLTQQWETERAGLRELNQLREQMDGLRVQLDKAMRTGDYETASKLQYSDMPELQRKIDSHEKVLRPRKRAAPRYRLVCNRRRWRVCAGHGRGGPGPPADGGQGHSRGYCPSGLAQHRHPCAPDAAFGEGQAPPDGAEPQGAAFPLKGLMRFGEGARRTAET